MMSMYYKTLEKVFNNYAELIQSYTEIDNKIKEFEAFINECRGMVHIIIDLGISNDDLIRFQNEIFILRKELFKLLYL